MEWCWYSGMKHRKRWNLIRNPRHRGLGMWDETDFETLGRIKWCLARKQTFHTVILLRKQTFLAMTNFFAVKNSRPKIDDPERMARKRATPAWEVLAKINIRWLSEDRFLIRRNIRPAEEETPDAPSTFSASKFGRFRCDSARESALIGGWADVSTQDYRINRINQSTILRRTTGRDTHQKKRKIASNTTFPVNRTGIGNDDSDERRFSTRTSWQPWTSGNKPAIPGTRMEEQTFTLATMLNFKKKNTTTPSRSRCWRSRCYL